MRRSVGFIAIAVCFGCGAAVSAAPPGQCRFTYRPLRVGDEARETIHFAVELKTILSQDGQVVNVANQRVQRDEHSLALRLPADKGQSAKVRITYETSTQQTETGSAESSSGDRPVAGKSYVVAREGEELVVTDDSGGTPPDIERAIVAQSLAGLGRPNPLGVFLDGRTLSVGETVRLPAEFSNRMLAGWDESLSKLPLEVMLMGTERVDGALCALLHTPPTGTGDSRGERAPVDGKFLVEIDTCRIAVVELRGPIAASEKRGSAGQQFDMRRKGKLQVAVHVEHRRAR